MSRNITKVKEFIDRLGFEAEVSDIYSTLVKFGRMTILELSRESRVERTKIYHVKDELVEKGLLEEIKFNNKLYLEACSAHKLKLLLHQENERIHSLNDSFEEVSSIMDSISEDLHPTSVKFYKGVNGIKQILWNELNARKVVYSFSIRALQEVVGEKFFKKWSREFDKRGLVNYDLRTKELSGSIKTVKKLSFKGDNMRYLDQKVLKIRTSMSIYNDTVVIFNWKDGEVFAVEIQNSDFAKMQKEMFLNYWDIAKILSEDPRVFY